MGYPCKDCPDKEFTTYKDLLRHRKRAHPQGKQARLPFAEVTIIKTSKKKPKQEDEDD